LGSGCRVVKKKNEKKKTDPLFLNSGCQAVKKEK
jgi:hypothetical protein